MPLASPIAGVHYSPKLNIWRAVSGSHGKSVVWISRELGNAKSPRMEKGQAWLPASVAPVSPSRPSGMLGTAPPELLGDKATAFTPTKTRPGDCIQRVLGRMLSVGRKLKMEIPV